MAQLEGLAKKEIKISGARTHNLKNLSLELPHRTFIVVTGLSGSGKTSLVFGTLFADWEAKYLQSFSAYARQLFGSISKPPVDYIKGILPSVSIQQRSKLPSKRSRIANSTGIYTHLKLLYARIGVTYSPISGQPVKKHDTSDVVAYIKRQPAGSKLWILSKLQNRAGKTKKESLALELRKGYTRVFYKGKTHFIEDIIKTPLRATTKEAIYLVIDRLIIKENDRSFMNRLKESVKTAFSEGRGRCTVIVNEKAQPFSNLFELDGMTFSPPSPQLFDFNSPCGACPHCNGLGSCIGIDREKVIPDENLSIYRGAVKPWESLYMSVWKEDFIRHTPSFPIKTPYKELREEDKKCLWEGDKKVKGIHQFFDHIISHSHKIHYRILQAHYRSFTTCETCQGTGLREETSYVKVGDKSLIEILNTPIAVLKKHFDDLILAPYQEKIAHKLLSAIKQSIDQLISIGLGHLVLSRKSQTLSRGEYQRITLVKALSSSLRDLLYLLDEPTMGLHPRDTEKVISMLIDLQKKGNTVIVIEHNEAVMRAADQVIDIGLGAGSRGGEVVFQGTWQELLKEKGGQSHTVNYLTGRAAIPLPTKRRQPKYTLSFEGISEHNIDKEDLQLPLHLFTVLTGVSGAGKSTLVKKVIYPTLRNHFEPNTEFKKKINHLKGDLDKITSIEFISQSTLGKSSRSTPITYTKAYDIIRKIFAHQPLAKAHHYPASHFSFNVIGGRCEKCFGEGKIEIEMQFMSSVTIVCDACQGKRFTESIREVLFQGKNIEEVLNMTIEEGISFFHAYPTIVQRLMPLYEIGLGYLLLGQPSSTLSYGEVQRLKLSPYLGNGENTDPTLFIFDELTTGLHFHDIHKLIKVLHRLVERGHTVLVVEHNLDVIKSADWVIDVGPEGGEKGGKIIFQGSPEELIKCKESYTAHYLKEKIERERSQ